MASGMIADMKSWQETASVVAEMQRLLADGRRCALATLVKLEGSSYRRPGAKLLIREDGSLLGNVSGGCLENDLRERAQKAIHSDACELVHYDTGEDENVVWGLGLGCNGKIDVFVQPCSPGGGGAIVAELARRLDGVEAFAVRTRIDAPDQGRIAIVPPGDAQTGLVMEDRARVFVDVLQPPADFVVIGAGEDAAPLVRAAADAGFRVTLVDHRPAYLRAELFPGARRLVTARAAGGLRDLPAHARTFVVVKNHAIGADKEWARLYAATPAPYVGLLGPKARREDILASLPADARPRFFGPVGLDIGAEGAEQIAFSIVAEALAVQAGRSGGHLRARAAPLHG